MQHQAALLHLGAPEPKVEQFVFQQGKYVNIVFTTLEGGQACVDSDNHQPTARNLRI